MFQQVISPKQLTNHHQASQAILNSLTSSNNVIRQQLGSLLNEINENIRQLGSRLTSLTASSGHVDISKADEHYLPQLRNILKKMKETNCNRPFIVDPLLEPLLESTELSSEKLLANVRTLLDERSKEQVTFYANRYGFSAADLATCNEFREPLSYFRNPLRSNDLIQHRQIRGFKTKARNVDEEEKKSVFSSWNSFTKPREDPFKAMQTILNGKGYNATPSSSLKKHKLGSIFDEKNMEFVDSNSKISNDTALKKAFAEGILYREAKEEKRSTVLKLIRFLILVSIGIFLYNSVSIVSTPGISNGNSSNGINLRSLTGTTNFEVNPESVSVRFSDVKGMPDAKGELVDIVSFLKNPNKFTKLGARLPKGVLMVGPPGCGKTLLAKAVAGEAGVPFFQASGSDFDEMFVGTGSKRVRQLFSAARANAPCVIFIDEIDAVGSKRTNSAVHPHANQTINQLLTEMDGFKKNEGVIVLGATNRHESLDNALLRPGRFDLEVRIDKPDLKDRIEILEFYLEKVKRDKDIDVKLLARQLVGFGGSTIENVVNQGALRAALLGSDTVKMEHLEFAVDRARMGYGKSRLLDEKVNINTAYHEAGHVLVAYFTKDSMPLHQVTILPRTKSLGHTGFVIENEHSTTRSQLMANMDVSYGGRIAEELIFGPENVTTGASNDYEQATNIAIQMVKIFGMSDKTGPRVFNKDDTSQVTQELIDKEVKTLVDESYARAKHILKTHSNELRLVAEALLDRETLNAEQIKRIIEGKKI